MTIKDKKIAAAREFLFTYCDPKIKYSGVSGYDLALRLVDVLDGVKEEDPDNARNFLNECGIYFLGGKTAVKGSCPMCIELQKRVPDYCCIRCALKGLDGVAVEEYTPGKGVKP